MTSATWATAQNWEQRYFEHESRGGEILIDVGAPVAPGAQPTGLAALENVLATNDCDAYCRPAAGGRASLDERGKTILKEHFLRHGSKYTDAARKRLGEITGQGQQIQARIDARLGLQNDRALPARLAAPTSKYAPGLATKLPDFFAWKAALEDPTQAPAAILARELAERTSELDALPYEQAAERVAHIAMDYADLFAKLFRANPKARFSGIIDMHVDLFFDALADNRYAPHYLAGDPDRDYLGNLYELLYGFDPLKREEAYAKPGSSWAPSLGLNNSIWLEPLRKWDQHLISLGKLAPDQNGALYDGSFPSTQFLLHGPDMTGDKPSSNLEERSPFSSTRLDFVLPFLEKAGVGQRIAVRGDSPVLLEAALGSARAAQAKTLYDQGYRLVDGAGRPVSASLERVKQKVVRTIEQAKQLPLEGREWRLVVDAPANTALSIAIPGTNTKYGAPISASSISLSINRTFETPLYGVDFVNGKGESMDVDGDSRLVAYRVNAADSRYVDRTELVPHAELVNGAWIVGFSDQRGQRIDPKEVGLFIKMANGELKADGLIKDSQSFSFAGMCLEDSIFRHFTATHNVPRLERGAGDFTASDLETLFATALISALADVNLLRGDSYRGPMAHIYFKQGHALKNIGIPEGTFDLLPTAARMDGMVGIPGSSLRGYLKLDAESGTERIVDAYLIDRFEQTESQGRQTFSVTYFDKFFTSPTTIALKSLPEGISLSNVQAQDGKKVLLNTPEAPFKGKIYVTFSNGTKKAYDPSEIAFMHQTTQDDISMIQTLQFVHVLSQKTGTGAFKGDNNVGPSVNNQSSHVDKVFRWSASDAQLPQWAKELGAQKKLVGLRGELSAEEKKNVVFLEMQQEGSSRFRGWVLIEPKLGWVVNGAVTMNRFDTLNVPDSTAINWKAPNIYNRFFDNEEILKLYVAALKPEQRAAAATFLPQGWERWIPAAEQPVRP